MTTIQYRTSDGLDVARQGVRADGKPPAPFPPRAGYATAQVDAIPAGPGVLRWQDNALARYVAPRSMNEQAQDAARAIFEAMPLWKQVFWENFRAAVNTKLGQGNFADARSIIADVPSQYDGMEADRDAFLALFTVTPIPPGPVPAPAA